MWGTCSKGLKYNTAVTEVTFVVLHIVCPRLEKVNMVYKNLCNLYKRVVGVYSLNYVHIPRQGEVALGDDTALPGEGAGRWCGG